MKKQSIGAWVLLGLLPLAAWADGLQSLEQFMRTAKAGRAQFTQTVTAPAREGETARSKVSRGSFEFQRPGQFKFVYTKPFEQTIVADGNNVWLYDVDLNQVTQRRQADALGSTPAAVLASANDVGALQKTFHLKALPAADGLEWVEAEPREADSQLKSVRVGFQGSTLAAMDILDNFGQRSVIRFEQMQVLPSLPAVNFRFEVPAGADIVQQ